ncbi:serine hydrolase domain-containing protein [Streptomyces sp. SID9727]|uniref:serine hydrolase domain-containing protein n=1 Tax=Streptomyces sp. SID9727 TaxID=2706114 RepID=UPI0013CCB162|nr:serine hydrolase domain-containing protein [Streptomyces sp. SID9727]NEC66131.1 beta-lactamase family protein [Streptomyces sp. SID9727]
MRALLRRRRGIAVLAGLTAVLVTTAAGLPATAAPPHPADALRRQVDAIHETGALGVLAEVAGPDGRSSARAGVAVAGTRKPMPWNGRFRIGSATKTFTAAVVLQLVGEGRVSLDDTVERWLPGVVQGHGNDGRLITVRQLLHHTSGLREVAPEVAALNSAAGYRAERFRTYTPDELVRLAVSDAPKFPPGEGWSYSNTNYVLAAMIVEKATGRSWAHEVEARIIRPLALSGTSVPGASPLIPGPHAHGYAAFGTEEVTDVTALDPSMAVGSGAVVSTAHDLNRFYAALLGGRLLAPAQLAEMTDAEYAPELRAGYGLGLAEIPLSCGGTFFAHRGELLGYTTWAGAARGGGRSAAVYINSDGGPGTEEAMLALMDQELCEAP